MLAGGKPYYMPLTKENDFLPDLDIIPEDIAKKAKFMWLNFWSQLRQWEVGYGMLPKINGMRIPHRDKVQE
ncbi:unnamed protein product [marine sediment metagenome]|uniref:Uncharacterized protein n=2 Tax=marine sediment metagenome TaxID=412755 RepID=X1RUY5_9ZZZZ